MKKLKKLAGILLALVMAMGLCVTAFAANDSSIIISNSKDGYEYTAYQIFSGEYADGVLSNIGWGSNIAEDDQSNAIAAVVAITLDTAITIDGTETTTPFASCKSAADIAAVLSGQGNDSEIAQKFADTIKSYVSGTGTASSHTLGSGTYEITDLAAGYYLVETTIVPTGGAYTRYILAVAGNATANDKSSAPSVEKKVQETNDSTTDAAVWQDAADYDIGDSVPFKLTATLPTKYGEYSTYKLIFHDTLSAGLTYNNDVKVYVDDTEVYADDYSVSTETDGDGNTILTVTITNTKNLREASDETTVISTSSSSKIIVTYSAKLNDNAVLGASGNPNKVYLEYSNNPNSGGSGDTGKTPEDKVTVFTFELVVNKINTDGALTGAEFTLYKLDGDSNDYKTVEVIGTDVDISKFTFTGLDSGTYKLSETVTPAGYNTAADIYFKIVADYDTTSDDPELKNLIIQDLDGNTISGTSESFTVNITATTEQISTDVLNQKGNVLPSTGGIGTTIFYIVGSILVLGAVVLLITRRRMRKS